MGNLYHFQLSIPSNTSAKEPSSGHYPRLHSHEEAELKKEKKKRKRSQTIMNRIYIYINIYTYISRGTKKSKTHN